MLKAFIEKMLRGDKAALSRLITLVERDSPETPQVMEAIYSSMGKAHHIGITGPPGSGKSTLVDQLTALIRGEGDSDGKEVGIIAVDPTSPFSGGALLGDRIRMQRHYNDEGVFIRSMATRGSHGGLSKTTRKVAKLLDAFGKEVVFIETVGVGQAELDVMEAADTVVVVLVPETGDAVQTMKAGLMEIADILVVNKSDRQGASALVKELEAMLSLNREQSWWQVPVLSTQAHKNVGIEDLYGEIQKHKEALEVSGRLAEKRQERRKKEFIQAVEQSIGAKLTELIGRDEALTTFIDRVAAGDIDPYSAASEVLRDKDLLRRWFSTLG
ncbi:MAG: methylmalonyl Co-A mutase-associated GTPase MeaB [Dehalococcoidia bacterium]